MNRCPSPKTSVWLFLLLLLSVPAVAQRGGDPTLSDAERVRRRDEATRRTTHRQLNDLVETPARPPKDRPNFYNKKLTPAQKQLVTPSPEDQAAYQNFLRQDHTGLVRLLPRGKYEFTTTVAADRDPEIILPIRGGGAFYSFAEKTHAYGPWSEISLNEGLLITGVGGNSLGLLVPLGDVPLESITPQSAGVEFLTRLTPPTHVAEAQEARNHNFQSFKVGNFVYSSVLRALPNMTYVMRSMIYKHEGQLIGVMSSTGTVPVYVPHPFEYEGADMLVAFRIVRVDADGSLTLLWKRLQKYQTPKLKKENRLAVVK